MVHYNITYRFLVCGPSTAVPYPTARLVGLLHISLLLPHAGHISIHSLRNSRTYVRLIPWFKNAPYPSYPSTKVMAMDGQDVEYMDV